MLSERKSSSGGCLRKFTLIEMLVVISIIGILAGLLSGPVTRSLNSARSRSCLNNLRQAGFAVQMYRDANKCFPYAANWADTEYKEGMTSPFSLPPISVALSAYTTPEIFQCPADNKNYYEKGKSSYEWNARLSGRPGELRGFRGRALKPSMVPILWDLDAFHGEVKSTTESITGGSSGEDVEEVEVKSSSDGSRNILYLDNSANPM